MKKEESIVLNQVDYDSEKKQNFSSSFLWAMHHAPSTDVGYHWIHMLPLAFFGAFIIMIVFMKTYTAPLGQFYWHNKATTFSDFFSYYKSFSILLSAIIAALLMLYRLMAKSLIIRKSKLYIPLIIYSILVILSLIFSKFPHFALYGYVDRFEGTFVLLSYVFMTFYAINTLFTEKNIKFMFVCLAISSSILGVLGISQYSGNDFFQTTFGKLLITPSYYKDVVSALKFTFNNGEIYQTVYNINYVSFYLTLLVPISGMIFIHEKHMGKKTILGLIFALLIFNLIGSKSSGGMLGLGISIIIGIIILNKYLIENWKSVLILFIIGLLIMGITFDRFLPELNGAIHTVTNTSEPKSTVEKHKIDYIDTHDDTLIISINQKPLIIKADLKNLASGLRLYDNKDNPLYLLENPSDRSFTINDERFDMYKFHLTKGKDNNIYLILFTDEQQWPFALTPEGLFYRNSLGNFVDLDPIESIGFENNDGFGSGRGYIWSRSIPLLKENIVVGSGADTYALVFPHKDYVGKYNSHTFSSSNNIIVDKPHSMYLQIGINTGLLSLVSLLLLFAAYIIWSIKLYMKNRDFSNFIPISGIGIFLGLSGFLTAALVNDSTVSTAPMFWSLLGIGIAINFIIENHIKEESI